MKGGAIWDVQLDGLSSRRPKCRASDPCFISTPAPPLNRRERIPASAVNKTWLFIGHPGAGERSAIIYSIIVSCQCHQISLVYLLGVLSRLSVMVNQDSSPLAVAHAGSPQARRPSE